MSPVQPPLEKFFVQGCPGGELLEEIFADVRVDVGRIVVVT